MIADFIASSLEKPFCIALQYLCEKLLEILFCSKVTLGSEVFKANAKTGLKKIKGKINPKKTFNKSKLVMNINIINKFLINIECLTLNLMNLICFN